MLGNAGKNKVIDSLKSKKCGQPAKKINGGDHL